MRTHDADGRPDMAPVLATLVSDSWTADDVARLPYGIAQPLYDVLRFCRSRQNLTFPAKKWPLAPLVLMGREDLAADAPAPAPPLLRPPYSLDLGEGRGGRRGGLPRHRGLVESK